MKLKSSMGIPYLKMNIKTGMLEDLQDIFVCFSFLTMLSRKNVSIQHYGHGAE